ncbi:MAG: hypothetical protein CFE21_09335 [Bacteroidetes bacterium B1(2017)]|nr:MAG: hypothetical protein CFE21_09335 [Bacteroidetes bacterium B1(2017)]
MANPIIHKILVTTGCIMWCAAFFGEAFQGQPYSTIGMILSPILTLIGIFYWFNHYRATRGHFPKAKPVLDNTATIGGTFTVSSDFLFRYASEFWTCCILIWMGFVLILVLTFRRSDAFEATKNYCESNQEILSQTGAIKYYGVLVGGNLSWNKHGGKADLSFTIVGTNGNFSAKSKLSNQGTTWTVDTLEIK